MSESSFVDALQRADERLRAAALSSARERQLRERILASTGRASADDARAARPSVAWGGVALRPAWALAALGVLGALALWLAWPRASLDEARLVAGFSVVRAPSGVVLAEVSGALEVSRSGGTDASDPVEAGGAAQVVHDEASIALEIQTAARVRKTDRGVAVERGRVVFSVEPRAPAAEREVVVSGGVITITGTRFTVEESGDRGWVELHEGAIRFVASGRAPIVLAPGERIAWPIPEEPQPDAPRPEPKGDEAAPVEDDAVRAEESAGGGGSSASVRPGASASAPKPSAAELLAEIERLRSQGRYEEAAARLAEHEQGLGEATQERLSYERGAILTYQLGDRERACAHWHAHEARFPGGQYAPEVARAKGQAECTP